MTDAVTPFRPSVGDDQLDDLRRRLAHARWPEPAPVTDWSQGVPVDWLRDLCAYWQDGYDWRRCEKRLQDLPQFTTELDGLGVHFIHVQSPSPSALPLVMTHGWPGSVVEFLDVIGPLADPAAHGGDPADAFHVVCPSLPGYGFVDSPVGQCAWITEKYWAWTDHDGDPTSALSRDQMLDNVMVYWLTATAASSARLYWESGWARPSGQSQMASARTIATPTGISIFPREIMRPSRRWCEKRYTDLRFYEQADRGGHFAAWEQPDLFVDHVRRAFRTMR